MTSIGLCGEAAMDALAKGSSDRLVAIVDDHEPLLRAMRFALETEGYKVNAFSDGDALLEAGDLGAVDCFVIDYKLPDRDGVRLIADLRGRGVDTAAILITTAPSERLRAEAARAGVPIVEKPLTGDALSRCISDLLAGEASRP
jgi:FixJ family two-component response regulator